MPPTGLAELRISCAIAALHFGHFTPGFSAVIGSQCRWLASYMRLRFPLTTFRSHRVDDVRTARPRLAQRLLCSCFGPRYHPVFPVLQSPAGQSPRVRGCMLAHSRSSCEWVFNLGMEGLVVLPARPCDHPHRASARHSGAVCGLFVVPARHNFSDDDAHDLSGSPDLSVSGPNTHDL